MRATASPTAKPIDGGDGEADQRPAQRGGDGLPELRRSARSRRARAKTVRRAGQRPRRPATRAQTTTCQIAEHEADREQLGPGRRPDPARQTPALAVRAGQLERVEPGDGARSASAMSVAMAADLLPQPVGDLGGERGDLGRVDAARPRDVDPGARDHPAGPAGQQHDPVTEPGRLAHVVGDEQDGEACARARSAPARRAGGRGSSRRARRTARPSAARVRPGRAYGPARPAAACRRRARAVPLARTPPGAPAAAARRRARVCSLAARRAVRSGSSTLPATISHGNSAGSWNISAGASARRRRRSGPGSGRSSPATRVSRVLLPQPDAPTRQTNSPAVDRQGDPVERGHGVRPPTVDLGHAGQRHRGSRRAPCRSARPCRRAAPTSLAGRSELPGDRELCCHSCDLRLLRLLSAPR